MIDRTKLKYNIGDIVEIIIDGLMQKATIIAYCFSHEFNDYTRFYCYGIQILDETFHGHSCNHIPFNANGNRLHLNITNGWYAQEKDFTVIKATRCFIYKVLHV